jgi:tRNA A-37 threonylcarbamoyl transferase component Bud32/membrane-associated phospholipid phosphatase
MTTESRAVQASPVHSRPSRSSRQRRPTGAPPPLPRSFGRSGKLLLLLVVLALAANIVVARSTYLGRFMEQLDTDFLQLLAAARVPWAVSLARGIKSAGSGWFVTVLGIGTVALLMFFRRWRHLLVYLSSMLVLVGVGTILYWLVTRPRPYGVTIVAPWSGFSMPSPPIMLFTAVLVGIAYTLVVPGKPRRIAGLCMIAPVGLLALARMYLAVDHPSDDAYGLLLGLAVMITMFRLLTPNEAFPVAYRRGNVAHLDVTGRRGEAVRAAVQEQLGLQVKDIKPVGLAGSGGSTPLRRCIAGDPNDRWLFAKLYAKSHVRSDRWYKLWRTILYGRLEDETSFQTVRRFVEYEDHMLRLLRDAGIRVPEAYGIVEITPEREYMLVTEFFDGAVEIGEAELDDDLIDQGLRLIRQLWDSGIAHRDIKPANLMVRDGQLLVIDVFFVQVRPSPWRQAVDLGNMLLVLALRTDPDRVYQRALAYFTPDELSEAIAASRGVASPTQLRQFMKRDGRDLLGRFRELAPPRKPIAIQRWSVRRVALAIMMLLVIAIAVTGSVQLFLPVQNLDVGIPACGTGRSMILMAQAVPSATRLPCVDSVPIGWQFINGSFRTGRASFWFGLENSGTRFLTVTLSPSCDVSRSEAVPSQFAGVKRYELAISVRPRLETIRSYVFRGGCVSYALSAPASGAADQTANDLISSGDAALTLMSRTKLAGYVAREYHLLLCGAAVRCRP